MNDTLNNQIISAIYTNTGQAITGNILQTVLLGMVSELGENSGFMGLATSGIGASVTVPDGKQWYICINGTSSTISYPRYIAGDTTNLQPGGIAIIYNIGNGWQWINLTGTQTDTNTILGKIAALASQMTTANNSIATLGTNDVALDAEIKCEVIRRLGILFLVSAETDDVIDFSSVYGIVSNGVYTETKMKLDAGDNEIYILQNFGGMDIDASEFELITNCTQMEVPANVRNMTTIGIDTDTNPDIAVWFHGATPPTIAETTTLETIGEAYTHEAFVHTYENAYSGITIRTITY